MEIQSQKMEKKGKCYSNKSKNDLSNEMPTAIDQFE